MNVKSLGMVLLSVATLSSCREKSSAMIERETKDMEQKTARLQQEAAALRSYIKASSEAQSAYAEALHGQQRIQIQIHDLIDERDSLQEDYNRFLGVAQEREADRIRRQRVIAAGKELGELITLRGRHFDGVVVTKASERGLDIIHADGATRISPEELSYDQRKELGVMALPKDTWTLRDSIQY